MVERKRLYPVEGRMALNPLSGLPLPPDGLEVSITQFWRRRLTAGDATTEAPKKKATPKAVKEFKDNYSG